MAGAAFLLTLALSCLCGPALAQGLGDGRGALDGVLELARQRHQHTNHQRQQHQPLVHIGHGSRPSAPSFPQPSAGVPEAALVQRPWSGAHARDALVADQRLLQLGQSSNEPAKLQKPDYSVRATVPSHNVDTESRLQRRSDAPRASGGAIAAPPAPATQTNLQGKTNWFPMGMANDLMSPQPAAQAQGQQPPPQPPPQQQQPSYDVHLYDANLISGIMAAAAATSAAAQFHAQAPMNNALANFYTRSTGPARTGRLPPSYPVPNAMPPTRRIPTTGFPLVHPFGEAPTPLTQNFGSLPEYPGRVPNAGAMQFEGRSQGVF